ncbi:molybdopterin synthase sulfur carrier subunit [Stutzerimonas stutzeri]|uniref:Molybdopterin synthase sulfur carrier subunit n=1 Tax=Stutzerimonas stutzeri TaxID=316 RepID=A0A2N8SY75_STUST|nr:MoaD/ThiS family protein [Stutzerimonas stutzeri]MCQ4326535.1 MoaD/ThiS family protein [Stutzerimonas stutzeri]PNG07450.1 molybdopterin synthase sulfur carrier subunit [Stutzerimonas stutzeri]
MISIQYFARYRETLGSEGERLEWDTSLACVDDVRQRLLARGGEWQVLGERNLMCARNQELCGLDEAVADGDEVAFFPTVTGG